MSLLDVLDKLEKLRILEDANNWILYRKPRNQLIYDCPDNKQVIISGIYLSIEAFRKIEIIPIAKNN